MAAAFAIARKNTSSLLTRANLGGRGLRHAPLPTRYGVAIHTADRVPPPAASTSRWGLNRCGDLHSGGRWGPWASAPYSSLSGGSGGRNRELEEIRALLQRQQEMVRIIFGELELVLRGQISLMKFLIEAKRTDRYWGWYWGWLLFMCSSLVCAGAWLSFTQGAETTTEVVREFLAIHLSKVIKDPKVQESIKISAETFLDSGLRKCNPYHRFMDWINGEGAGAEKASVDDLVSRTCCLSFFILLLLEGTKFDEAGLIKGLSAVGMTEVELINKTVALLVSMGYLEKFSIKGPSGDETVYFVVAKDANGLKDFRTGKMQNKIKKLLSKSWIWSWLDN